METLEALATPYHPTKDWTEQDWDKFTNWLTGMLKINETVTVTFTKVDGSERVMNCTLALLQKMSLGQNLVFDNKWRICYTKDYEKANSLFQN